MSPEIPDYLRTLYQFERDYGDDKRWCARSKSDVVAYGTTAEEALEALKQAVEQDKTLRRIEKAKREQRPV